MKSEQAQLWQDILYYIRPYRRHFWLGTLLCAFSSAIWLVIPWAIGEIISFSAAYQAGGSTRTVWEWLGVIGGVTVLYYTTQELSRYWIYMIGEKASVDVQLRVLAHMGQLDLRWHETENSGNKIKKISRGGHSLNVLLRMYVDTAIDAAVGLIGVSVIFATFSWELNALLGVFFVVHYALSSYLTRRATDQAREVNRIEEEFSGIKFEMLNGIATVKTLGIQEGLLEYTREISARMLVALAQRIILFRTRLASLGFNQQIFRILTIAFSVWQVIEGNFEVGVIAQVFFYFSRIESSAQRFSSLYHQFVMAQIDMTGVRKILDQPAHIEGQGTRDYPSNWQRFEIRGLSFAYQGKPVLEDIHLSLCRGEKIGLVGASGEGKSTLFKLMQKLYDEYEGFMGFDDIPLREISRSSLVPHIGVVLQDTELFNLSIADNIVLGQRDGTNTENLAEVSRLARVDIFAERAPQGMDTVVGEKGIRLSGGERQRLGLARALYRRPDLLFLDEATSHLDAPSERMIQAALDEVLEKVTAVVAAHRLSTLRKMDRILVLKGGRIVEQGNFETLLAQKGPFWKLYRGEEEGSKI